MFTYIGASQYCKHNNLLLQTETDTEVKMTNTHSTFTAGANKVSFSSKGIKIIGVLYLPSDFDPSNCYEGVVMTPPFPQVKDQVLGNYGPRVAECGYVALSFDYNSKGESDTYQEGFRDDEDIPASGKICATRSLSLDRYPSLARSTAWASVAAAALWLRPSSRTFASRPSLLSVRCWRPT